MTDTHKAQPEQEPVYQIKVYGSQTAWHDAGSSAYDLTSPNERRILYTTPPQRKPLTDEMVLAGARALAKRHADSCGLDFDDVWKYYADEHKDDAKVVIEAAHGIKE